MGSPTIASLVAAHADDDRRALLFGDRTWTWSEVVAESVLRAHVIDEMLEDASPRHIGVLMGNRPDYVFILFGAALVGATVVGINATRRGDELVRDIVHTDCQHIITDDKHLALLDHDRLPPIHSVDHPHWASANHKQRGKPIPPDPGPDALFVLIFTSGSTSAPKAVRRSQGMLAVGNTLGFTDTDVLYSAMPLSHGNGLSGNLLPALQTGASIVLKERFSASELMPEIRKHGVTYFNTVGRALSYILATPEHPDDKFHQLKWVLAPESSQRDAEDFAHRFGVTAMSGYGSSESGIAMNPCPVPGAMGLAKPNQDIAVVDPETLMECAVAVFSKGGVLLNSAQAIGEIVRRDGFGGFEGYYNNDEATRERTRDGWYHSGDLAYRDSNGIFFFAGRMGDWIRVDSENFATAPIERILARHPDVAAVAVFAVPDAHNGDQVMAAVELRTDFDAVAFKTWLGEQPDLGTKWAPRFVRIAEHLPVTGNDKLAKAPLRAAGWRTADPVWWQPSRDSDYELMTAADVETWEKELGAHGRAHLIAGAVT